MLEIALATSVHPAWLFTGDGEMFERSSTTGSPFDLASIPVQRQVADAQTQIFSRGTRLGPDEIRRLERAITIIEQALADVRREAPPEVKAGMISAAYELLEDPSDATVGRILRLVKG